jgi:hypothetical protein
MSADDRMTVTMLGTTRCGKTTYLHGMYAVLSAGQNGFFLHAEDPDLDLELSDQWDDLVEKGTLPQPNNEEPKSYPFTFRSGFMRLLSIDWLDYRGGAMSDRVGQTDARVLIDRLAQSDSIYLTLDGAVLADELENADNLNARRRMKAERMTMFVHRAAESRGGRIPSIVILITKFDLVARRFPNGAAAVEGAIAAAKDILPVAFEPGVTTLICPVTIGDFGLSTGERVDPALVKPQWVHKPMLFSMLYAEWEREQQLSLQMSTTRQTMGETAFELARLQSGFMSIFRRGQIRAHEQQMNRIGTTVVSDEQLLEKAQRQALALAREFVELPIYVDGQRVDFS